MQTFLPYPDFALSASVLDRARLGKQRVETMQIMQCLAGVKDGWSNHPAVTMWKGCETTLMEYQRAICTEWKGRGYKDTCLEKTFNVYLERITPNDTPPLWLGVDEFHASHRANLLRKFPAWYSQFGWSEDPSIPYWWPTKQLELTSRMV